MEYTQITASVSRQFEQEDRDIAERQAEVDAAQVLLDRRRRALKRKKGNFDRLLQNWQNLDAEVVSGKPAAAEETGDAREPGSDEDEAAREDGSAGLLVSHLLDASGPGWRSSQAVL